MVVATFARWRGHGPRRTIDRSNRESLASQRHQLAAAHLDRIVERPVPAAIDHTRCPLTNINSANFRRKRH